MTTVEILREARKLIEEKRNWFGGDQRILHKNQRCVWLAVIDAAAANEPSPLAGAFVQLRVVASPQSITDWNDSSDHVTVLAGIDRAIKLAGGAA